MIKILLTAVNAKYIHSCPAVYSLRRCVPGDKAEVVISEFTINHRYEDLIAGVMEPKADVIGFSTYIWNASQMKDLMADVRAIRGSGVILFAGGPEATNDPESFLQWCDFVMMGEGEKLIKDVAEILSERGTPEERRAALSLIYELPGIAFRDAGGRVRRNPVRLESRADIDRIPFLYENLDGFENRIIYYESSRGCPFHCTYCLSSIDKDVRFRNLETVKKELQFFLDRNVRQVKFVDRTFNCARNRAREIWTYIKDHDNGITNFHFEIGADLLRNEDIELLKTLRPGLVQLEIGIQTTNPKTMKAIQRTSDLNSILIAVSELRKAGNINLHTDLIAGLPYEGFSSFSKSFNDVYPLRAHQLQLGFLKVLKGTVMAAKAEEYGLVYSVRQPYEVYSTNWISYEELMRLHRITDVLELFYNSEQFTRTLPYLEGFYGSPFEMYDRLADYFVRNSLFDGTVNARRRYEVLKDFAAENTAMSEQEMKTLGEYLRFDYDLHFHQSRRTSKEEVFEFKEGRIRVRFDYTKKDPVSGEAVYEILT